MFLPNNSSNDVKNNGGNVVSNSIFQGLILLPSNTANVVRNQDSSSLREWDIPKYTYQVEGVVSHNGSSHRIGRVIGDDDGDSNGMIPNDDDEGEGEEGDYDYDCYDEDIDDDEYGDGNKDGNIVCQLSSSRNGGNGYGDGIGWKEEEGEGYDIRGMVATIPGCGFDPLQGMLSDKKDPRWLRVQGEGRESAESRTPSVVWVVGEEVSPVRERGMVLKRNNNNHIIDESSQECTNSGSSPR